MSAGDLSSVYEELFRTLRDRTIRLHGSSNGVFEYRLVPEVQWPSGPEDVRGVIAWIRENIADYGGDPDAVFLMGNSAGTRHVASYLYHQASHFDDGSGVAGGILSSGSYGASGSETNRLYYGADPEVQAALVPLGLVDAYEGPEIPVFLWSAELDPGRNRLVFVEAQHPSRVHLLPYGPVGGADARSAVDPRREHRISCSIAIWPGHRATIPFGLCLCSPAGQRPSETCRYRGPGGC